MLDVPADDLPCAVVLLDGEAVVSANALFAEWTGIAPESLPGTRLGELLDEPPPASTDFPRIAAADGSFRPVLVSRSRTGDGRTVIVLTDATERRAIAERMLSSRALEERTRARLELIIESSIAFAAAESEAQLADILAHTVAQAYRAEESTVVLADDRGGFRIAAGGNPFAGTLETADLLARAAHLREVVKVSGADEAAALDPALGAAMRASGVHAFIVAPLRHDDESLGVFGCFFRHVRRFDAEAAPLADALAGQAAQVATTLRLQRRLQHAATHDDTTGLPNRRYLEEQSARLRNHLSGGLAAIFIDLDGFKRINDDLGHHTGDHVLREVGRRLQSALREDDIVARYGGDEFIVLCEVDDGSAARDLAERLRRNLAAPFDLLPEGFAVGASIGVALAARGGEVDIDPLIRSADLAMYRAKSAGGHRIVIDDDSMPALPDPRPQTSAVPQAPALADALAGAVRRGELSAWFQPQADLATGRIVAAEALCRWHHPQLGTVGPATFIPIAEDAGLIGEIGRFMVEECFLALARWSSVEHPLDVSVNVSPLQLRTSAFTDWLAAHVRARDLFGGRLTIEITESRPVVDAEAVVERLEELRELGVGVAIDDFGAGHASLSQLERLHGTEVKLDRSLVSDLSDQATAEMTYAIEVARLSGIRVVAEGVETAEHLERATRLGCDRAQGYLIGRPLSADAFGALFASGETGWAEAG